MTLEPPPDLPDPDLTAYRKALGAFATGVCVVTADSPQGPLGITINSFTSVSLQPRLILWCLDERSERWPVFAAADRFSLHVLGGGDRDDARRFARGICLLEEGEYVRDDDFAPHLPDVLARFDCEVHARIPMGDHVMIVGRVERFLDGRGDGLAFFRGRFGTVSETGS